MSRKTQTLATSLLLILSGLCSCLIYALDSDKRQTINIQADIMTLDESTGTTTYNGNVELSQGSIKVKADTIVIHNINGSIESMHMSGNHNPATFEQETINGELARGQAMHIQYDSRNSKLTLTGSAKMQQGKNKIRSHRIDYNSATNNLSAGNPIDPGKKQHDSQRVRIVITPDENNPE